MDIPEICFIGRSNVGKSSLINQITKVKNLAKTSKTPGRTQAINLFLISDRSILAALPGYGFSRFSKNLNIFVCLLKRGPLSENMFLEKNEKIRSVLS